MTRRRVALLLLLSGCHAWPSRPLSVVGPGYRTVRVITDSGRRRVVIGAASAVGDSVIGRLTSTDTLRADGWARLRAGSGERVAIPVSEIVRVEVRELDGRRTFGWLIPVAGLVLLLAAVAAMLPTT